MAFTKILLVGLMACTASGLALPVSHRGIQPKLSARSNSLSTAPTRASNLALRGGGSPVMSADFGVKVLAPLCGNILGTMMFLASTPAVLKAKKDGKLGALNPSPFPALVGNCAAWLFYGFEVMNWWIIMPNISGICIGLFYLISAWPLCSPAQQKGFTTTLSLYGALFAATIAGLRLGLIKASVQTAYGLMANFCLLFFYAAPILTLASVVKAKDASSIDPLLAGCGAVNGLFWLVYGKAINDIYVWLPNGIGSVLSSLTMMARIIVGVPK